MTSPRTVFLALLAPLFPVSTFVPPADAQPDTTRWTLKLAMQYDQITETAISPGGDHVAYIVREAVMDDQIGTPEDGTLADLIVVDRNPLADLSALGSADGAAVRDDRVTFASTLHSH